MITMNVHPKLIIKKADTPIIFASCVQVEVISSIIRLHALESTFNNPLILPSVT